MCAALVLRPCPCRRQCRLPPPLPRSLRRPVPALRCPQIPVQLRLADSEVSSLEKPPALYVSRAWHQHTAYSAAAAASAPCPAGCNPPLLPTAASTVPPPPHPAVPRAAAELPAQPGAARAATLQHLLPPGELVPWFEHGSLPLKWWVRALGAGVAAWAGHGVQKGESWCARLPAGAPTARERWRLSVQPRCFARLQGRAGGSPVRFGGGARQGAALAPHPPLPRLPRQVRLMPLCLMIPSCT